MKILAGVVDTDRYASHVHFPFVAVGEDGAHVLSRGTPLAQVIPFRRATTGLRGVVRAERDEVGERRERIFRSTIAADGWYRLNARAKR